MKQSNPPRRMRLAQRSIFSASLLLALPLLSSPSARAQAQSDPTTGMLCGMTIASDGSDLYVPCAAMALEPQLPPSSPRSGVWGAIAVSASSMKWGTSWNYKTEVEAATAALAQCQAAAKSLGAKDCKVSLTLADVCAAIVYSLPEKLIAIGGPTGATNFAADNAKLICKRKGGKSCTLGASFCADGIRHVLDGQTAFSNRNPVFAPEAETAAPMRQ